MRIHPAPIFLLTIIFLLTACATRTSPRILTRAGTQIIYFSSPPGKVTQEELHQLDALRMGCEATHGSNESQYVSCFFRAVKSMQDQGHTSMKYLVISVAD